MRDMLNMAVLLIIFAGVGICAIAGFAGAEQVPGYLNNQERIRSLRAEIEELESEARAAEAEAEKAAAEARRMEALEALERAKAEQIRAEGEREEREANAYVERKMGAAAAAAINRQGRLLTLYTFKSVVGESSRMIFVGFILGLGIVAFGLLAVSYIAAGRRLS
jgi:F0F1-type ATP synthase membrane subunit b/b'